MIKCYDGRKGCRSRNGDYCTCLKEIIRGYCPFYKTEEKYEEELNYLEQRGHSVVRNLEYYTWGDEE